MASGFQRIDRDTKYAYFQVNGFDYRTDGQSVQGKDGNTWNTTYSLAIILKAREAFKLERKAA